MSALPSSVIEPVWGQFSALLPDRAVVHPLGRHRPRIPDRTVFDKLVQVLVFGCAYHRIADATRSATTLRRRRDEWIALGLMDRLRTIALAGYDRMIGLELDRLAVDGCITKAPCGGEVAGRFPLNRDQRGPKRSPVVDANGTPFGAVVGPANRHDAPLLVPTLDTLAAIGPVPATPTVHLDRGYDSQRTRERLADVGFRGGIAEKGRPVPIAASDRWPVERTNAWTNAHKKLVWCTERRATLVACWLAFSAVVVIVRRLLRAGWVRYRWDRRPSRQP